MVILVVLFFKSGVAGLLIRLHTLILGEEYEE